MIICLLPWLTDKKIGETTISGDTLVPVKPEKKDTVIIIRGQGRQQQGKLIGIDAPDGIVNINESEITILKFVSHIETDLIAFRLENLARAAEWR